MRILMVIYMVIPVFIGLLLILSFDERIPDTEGEKPEGIEKIFLKTASYIFRRFVEKNRLFLKSHGRRRVRENLQKLDSEADVQKRLSDYYIKKISVVLIIVFLGSLLSLLSCFSSRRNTSLNSEGEVIRSDYGKGDRKTQLVAMDEEGEKLGAFNVSIAEKEYSEKESEELYKEMLKALSQEILLENKDLRHVKSDLKLPSQLKGYPFEISWKSDNIDVIHSDGKVMNEDIFFETSRVLLTANITYRDYEWENDFEITVVPRDFTDEEIIKQEIEGNIKKTEEETRTKDRFMLPANVEGIKLFWKEATDENSIMILMLSIIAAATIFIAGDRDLTKKVEYRRRQMILEYPAFVSRLVLYMGSGMSVRAILKKFANEYKAHIKDGGKRSFLYEEILKSCNELESGVPELNVYERLGVRCGSQQYARLVTLLSQNLKKGNSEMMALLREESDKATIERMSYARKLGEEAGTKLLVPMILMLLIVMVVIMIPAYLSF
ncbi:Type II secretion system (T2SS), protein F [Butyrivibrio sp. ob235]|uniref:immunoglobulin-like domain-containing protein n=1 Tax=Butyrivibrio sp. ob235 TaxID=1761780 RepID=UPI0008B6A01B|nr:immunoglobulin-like domain-containing protein [Butyrivibrio sp. ob235]SEL66219.1 Type II secretion system (T2SS), protein F [Butyrivibrio sp. ob235]